MRDRSRFMEEGVQSIVNAVPIIITGTAEESAKAIVQWAEALAQKLQDVKDVKMAQVRDIFDELRQIESLWTRNAEAALHRLHLLKPRLAYRAARIEKLRPLAEVLRQAIDEVVSAGKEEDKRERFRRLMEFVEAIVAYHKAHGGE